MRFRFNLTIPADTPQISPTTMEAQLGKGTITQILVQFKRGPHNRVFVVVKHGLFQLAPAIDGTYLFGDGIIHQVPMNYPLTEKGSQLTLCGWSPDTRYEHTVTVDIDLEETQDDMMSRILAALFTAPGKVE